MECGVFDEETKERLLNATLGHYALQRFPTQGLLFLGNKCAVYLRCEHNDKLTFFS